MRAWYIPSWNGDHRLEEHPKHGGSLLTVHDPTPAEVETIERFLAFARGKGWTKVTTLPAKGKVDLSAPVSEAGLELARLHHAPASDRTITAVRFEGGKVEVATLSDEEETKKLAEKAEEDKESKAATTKRATPCCPQCLPGAVGPASEVLLSFLTAEQHRDWSRHRAIEVEGGLSQHRYILAHRHSKLARHFGRIGYDADDSIVMHFYDWSVPPEEEVLSAMLILQHREPWLRNEATCFGGRHRFKNPFGGVTDGTETSFPMQSVGATVLEALGMSRGEVYNRGDGVVAVPLAPWEPFLQPGDVQIGENTWVSSAIASGGALPPILGLNDEPVTG